MIKFIKMLVLVISCALTCVNCSGQSNYGKFDLFFSKFSDFKFPVNPVDFLAFRKGLIQSWDISNADYDLYLREQNDKFWKFEKDYSYTYGGKCNIGNCWLIFYSRHFLPDDVNIQKGEFVLATFTFDGKMISALPVSGGYGDNLTFTSIINNPKDIIIDYTHYSNTGEEKYTRHYYIDANGIIQKKN